MPKREKSKRRAKKWAKEDTPTLFIGGMQNGQLLSVTNEVNKAVISEPPVEGVPDENLRMDTYWRVKLHKTTCVFVVDGITPEELQLIMLERATRPDPHKAQKGATMKAFRSIAKKLLPDDSPTNPLDPKNLPPGEREKIKDLVE